MLFKIVCLFLAFFAASASAQNAPSVGFAGAIGKRLSVDQMRELARPIIVDARSQQAANGGLGAFMARDMICPDIFHESYPGGTEKFSCNYIHEKGVIRWGRQPRVTFYQRKGVITAISVIRPYNRYANQKDPSYLRYCVDMEGSPGAIATSMSQYSGWKEISRTQDNKSINDKQGKFILLSRGNVFADVIPYLKAFNPPAPMDRCSDHYALSRTVFWNAKIRNESLKTQWLRRIEE